MTLPDLIHQFVKVGQFAHVGLYGHSVAAEVLDRRVKLILSPRGDNDFGPFGNEALGGRQSDAAASAGDEGDLAFELLRHRNSPEWRQ